MTDRDGNTHDYSYDALGRMTEDRIATFGAGVDQSVKALTYTYNAQGLPFMQSSYDSNSTSLSSGEIVSQVKDIYNGFGQLIAQYQAYSGPVSTHPSEEVQYVYGPASTGSRLIQMVYPNGRILDYGYDDTSLPNGQGALDNAIGRLDSESDDAENVVGTPDPDSTPDVAYQYMGLSAVVVQTFGDGTSLTYEASDGDALGDGGDQVTGLDRFGRVIDQDYTTNPSVSADSTDRIQYGYDADGNVLYENNLLHSSASELFTYDGFNRLTSYEEGELSDDNTVISSPVSSQNFNYDALGNQTSVTTNGTTVDRSSNDQNQLTTDGSADLAYDNNGNTLTDENGNTYTYDAWNHLITVTQPADGGTLMETFAYNADGQRITDAYPTATVVFTYSSSDQNIEESLDGSSGIAYQLVWGETYGTSEKPLTRPVY
jgi:hypothetical protein